MTYNTFRSVNNLTKSSKSQAKFILAVTARKGKTYEIFRPVNNARKGMTYNTFRSVNNLTKISKSQAKFIPADTARKDKTYGIIFRPVINPTVDSESSIKSINKQNGDDGKRSPNAVRLTRIKPSQKTIRIYRDKTNNLHQDNSTKKISGHQKLKH